MKTIQQERALSPSIEVSIIQSSTNSEDDSIIEPLANSDDSRSSTSAKCASLALAVGSLVIGVITGAIAIAIPLQKEDQYILMKVENLALLAIATFMFIAAMVMSTKLLIGQLGFFNRSRLIQVEDMLPPTFNV